MDTAGLEARPLSGWIMPSARGTFEMLEAFEPGGVMATFLHVIEGDELVDTIAWERERPGTWWARRDLLTHIGDEELTSAWYDERPARLLETPAAYVAAHGRGFVILDWYSCVNAVIGRVAAVECATERLYKRLRETLIDQALPGGWTSPLGAIGDRHDVGAL